MEEQDPFDDDGIYPQDPFGYLTSSEYWNLKVPTNVFEDYECAGLGVRVQGGDTRLIPPTKLAGFFYINNPFRREELWNDVRFRHKDELQIQEINGNTAIVCIMEIANRITQENLYQARLDRNDEIKKSLDRIAENYAFLPWIIVEFDWKYGYYRAQISRKSLDLDLR